MGVRTLQEAPAEAASFPYPGIPSTADGTAMIVHVEAHITQCAAAYPITSSTNMGVGYQAEVANGKRNVWDEQINFIELESEHSSASACEGYALAGGRVTNFTSGQGLILMKEVLYTISGKRLPVVFHIAARALTSHALNVHAGHDDVMGVADAGWGMVFAKNAQDAADLALITRRTAENCATPFLNVQDGFLTSHTIEDVVMPEPEFMKAFIGKPSDKLRSLMDPSAPLMSGVVQNQDSYMSGKIAQRHFYAQVKPALQEAFDEFYRQTGRRHSMIECVGMEDAEYAIISMGSTAETAFATVAHMRSLGLKVGAIAVMSYRPFPGPELVEVLQGLKAASVIERLDVPLAVDNPLTADIEAALAKAVMGTPGYPKLSTIPVIYTGTGGLGSRDVTPGHMIAVARNMMVANGDGKRYFSLGITHESALEVDDEPDVRPEGAFSIRGHSVGGYGSVTTNKVIATCLGDIFGFPVQASPKYGSEKKGLPTNTYLTTTPEGKIMTHSELQQVEFVPLMDPNTWNMGNPLVGLGPGGIIFQHTDQETPEGLWDSLPVWAKYAIHENEIRVFGVDTVRIARESCQNDDSLVQRFQGIVLLGVFLKLTPFHGESGMSEEDMFTRVLKPLDYYFGRKGEAVVKDNLEAVKRGYEQVFEVPRSVIDATPADVLAQGKEEWDKKGKDTNAFFV